MGGECEGRERRERERVRREMRGEARGERREREMYVVCTGVWGVWC